MYAIATNAPCNGKNHDPMEYGRISRADHNRNDSARSIATQLNLRPYML